MGQCSRRGMDVLLSNHALFLGQTYDLTLDNTRAATLAFWASLRPLRSAAVVYDQRNT
jgi:hypothetical protein